MAAAFTTGCRPEPLALRLTCRNASGTGTGPYPGLLAEPAPDPRFFPVSGSKGPPLVLLQLVPIPVHGYDIHSGPGRVPGLVILLGMPGGPAQHRWSEVRAFAAATAHPVDAPLAGEDGFTIAVAAPVGMEPVSRHRRQNETSSIAIPSASSGKEAVAFTGCNPAAPLAVTVLDIRFPKGNSSQFFRNRPSPEIACKRGKSARSVPCVLSSKGAEQCPKGKSWQFLYTGMTSNPAPESPRTGDFAAVCEAVRVTPSARPKAPLAGRSG